LAPFSLPPLFIIQTRIQEAIAFSFLQKIANPSSFFFSQASGISWQPIAPPPPVAIDYEKITLEYVSLFPHHLESLPRDTRKTLD
jgi:hypothetical protein